MPESHLVENPGSHFKGSVRQHSAHHSAATEEPVPPSSRFVFLKRAFDVVAAALLLLALSPVFLLVAAIVKFASRGPVIYAQRRVGLRGRTYTLYKIRSMYQDCERESGPQWARRNDPRITTVGRFLRRTHLDELPQLWNVLLGDMSLVGPRPERPEFVQELEKIVPFYRARLLVRPGITGLAQVQLPPDDGIASVRRKVAYDIYYIRDFGAWLDFRILLETIRYAVRTTFGSLLEKIEVPGGEQVIRPYEEMASRRMAVMAPHGLRGTGPMDPAGRRDMETVADIPSAKLATVADRPLPAAFRDYLNGTAGNANG